MNNHLKLAIKVVSLIGLTALIITLAYQFVFDSVVAPNPNADIPALGEGQSAKRSPPKVGELPEVYWEDLAKLDYDSGVAEEALAKLHGQSVRVPGFAVPLEDDLQNLREFLLVPNAMACIHVPPPPPNQMVLVKMSNPLKIIEVLGPLWITGKLLITKTESEYGAAGFEMQGTKVEPYEVE